MSEEVKTVQIKRSNRTHLVGCVSNASHLRKKMTDLKMNGYEVPQEVIDAARTAWLWSVDNFDQVILNS